jgi:hypothetical protein
MKRIFFLMMTAMHVEALAREESGYSEKLREETNRIIDELKSVGRELGKFVSAKTTAEKNKEKQTHLVVCASSNVEPLIIESCDHCKELCAKDQTIDYFA